VIESGTPKDIMNSKVKLVNDFLEDFMGAKK
jgi:hypothetical protein